MRRRLLTLLLVAGLAAPQPWIVAAPANQADADLTTGIRQVREGEFEAALVTLDGVVKRLSAQKGRGQDLARAYTYLAIAYVGMAEQEKARAKFLEAWRADRTFALSPSEFPPSIIEAFERARREGERDAATQALPVLPAVPPPQPSVPQASPPPPEAKRRGKSKLPLVLLGGAVVAGGAAAAAGGGGKGATAAPTPAPGPAPALPQDSMRLLSVDPPPGSTIRGFNNGQDLVFFRVDFSVTSATAGTFLLVVRALDGMDGFCIGDEHTDGQVPIVIVQPGEARTVRRELRHDWRCTAPFQVTGFKALWVRFSDHTTLYWLDFPTAPYQIEP